MGGDRYGPGPAARGPSQQWQGKPAQALDALPASEYRQPRDPVSRDSFGRQVDFAFALYVAKGIRVSEVTANDHDSSTYSKSFLAAESLLVQCTFTACYTHACKSADCCTVPLALDMLINARLHGFVHVTMLHVEYMGQPCLDLDTTHAAH